jgi:hypothetical protein
VVRASSLHPPWFIAPGQVRKEQAASPALETKPMGSGEGSRSSSGGARVAGSQPLAEGGLVPLFEIGPDSRVLVITSAGCNALDYGSLHLAEVL